jgi:hypothetical protein
MCIIVKACRVTLVGDAQVVTRPRVNRTSLFSSLVSASTHQTTLPFSLTSSSFGKRVNWSPDRSIR